jgi:protoporphyrinogen oxidase
MFYCTKLQDWKKIDRLEASAWIKKWIGREAYDVLWKRLFQLKFHKYANNLSASWIWARIRRVGQSRKSLFQETMGYLQGGSKILLDKLDEVIAKQGGRIHLSTPVQDILIDQARVTGVRLKNNVVEKYDAIISTVPLPFVPKILNALPDASRRAYESIQNIGVVCLIFKMKRPISPHFWLNISDASIEIPGIIEMSNLQVFDSHIVYVPFYMPQDHAKYSRTDDAFISECVSYFKKLSPSFQETDIIDAHVSRYAFAQPICPPAFLDGLPPVKSSIEGLYIMDTSYYYPEDRSISESVKLGRELVKAILAN